VILNARKSLANRAGCELPCELATSHLRAGRLGSSVGLEAESAQPIRTGEAESSNGGGPCQRVRLIADQESLCHAGPPRGLERRPRDGRAASRPRDPPRAARGLQGGRSTQRPSARPGMYCAAIFESLRACSVLKGQNQHTPCSRATSKHALCWPPGCLYFAFRCSRWAGDPLSKPDTLPGHPQSPARPRQAVRGGGRSGGLPNELWHGRGWDRTKRGDPRR